MTKRHSSGTPSQRVRKKYPKAFAKEGLMSGRWYIHSGTGKILAVEDSARVAWAKAAYKEMT